VVFFCGGGGGLGGGGGVGYWRSQDGVAKAKGAGVEAWGGGRACKRKGGRVCGGWGECTLEKGGGKGFMRQKMCRLQRQ